MIAPLISPRRPERALRLLIAACTLTLCLVVAHLGHAQRRPKPRPDAGAPSASASALVSAPASSSAAPVEDPAPSAQIAPPPPPSSSAAPLVSAAPQTSAVPAVVTPGEVRLKDRKLFSVLVDLDGRSALERAREATSTLERVAKTAKGEDVAVRRSGELAIVLVGSTPIIHLGPEDARAAGATSVDAQAANVALSIRSALEAEKQRSQIARTVIALSLVVALLLVALFLARKVGDFAARARRWLEDNPDRVRGLRFRTIEVVNAGVLRTAVLAAITVAKWVAQIGIAYGWLIISLGRFESTRGYTEQLTGFVLTPLSTLLERLLVAVPLAVIGIALAVALVVLLRFLGLFFAAVERGETQVSWLSAELARPTSLLVRGLVIVVALVLLGPIVTGETSGPLSTLGIVCLMALGLASTPFLASVMLGAFQLYTGRLRPGVFAQVGGRSGRVVEVNLFEVRLTDAAGGDLRVPHLLALVHPTRIAGPTRRVSVRLAVAASVAREPVMTLLGNAAAMVGEAAQVEVVGADAKRTRFRVSVSSEAPGARGALHLAVLGALAQARVPLA